MNPHIIKKLDEIIQIYKERMGSSDIDDNLTDQHTNLSIDGFKSPEEVLKFLEFLKNPLNLKRIKDKNTLKILYQKYHELLDFIAIADPYFKAKAKDLGVVVSRGISESKGNHMKKDKIKLVLESVKSIKKTLNEAMSVPGDEWDDEGNYIGGGMGGGRRFRRFNNYGYKRPYTPPVAPSTPAAGASTDERTLKATRIANAIAKKKGLPSADQGLISWVLKQMDAGKFTEENEATSLVQEAAKLLEKAKKKIGENPKRFTKKGERQIAHITKSEIEAGKSPEEAKKIACATATKTGNRKEGK